MLAIARKKNNSPAAPGLCSSAGSRGWKKDIYIVASPIISSAAKQKDIICSERVGSYRRGHAEKRRTRRIL
jgi:hypothetical protein